MPGLKERAKTLIELVDSARYLYATRPIRIEDRAAGLLNGQARAMIGALLPVLQNVETWEQEKLEAAVRKFADEHGLKLGSVAQPLRAALTGRTTSPGIFDVLAVLGQPESIARLKDQAAQSVVGA
jgi:glutamyl-tRNA synthetase